MKKTHKQRREAKIALPIPPLPPKLFFGHPLEVTVESDRKDVLDLLLGKSKTSDTFRQLFEEWRTTGISEYEVERPFTRDLPMELRARCASFMLRHPLRLLLRSGGHRVFLSDTSDAAWSDLVSPGSNPAYEEDKAIEAFIAFTGATWCFGFSKCRECERYFDMGRLPKEEYPFGVHCPNKGCQRAQSQRGAISAADKKRLLAKTELLVLTIQALNSWAEPSVKPDSSAILKKAKILAPEKVKRLGLTVQFISRNRKQIDSLALGSDPAAPRPSSQANSAPQA